MLKLFAAFAGVTLAKVELKARLHSEAEYWQLWQEFLGQFSEGIAKYEDSMEYNRRYEIFKDNMDIAKKHNSEGHSFTMGVTQFADLTGDEFEAFLAKSGSFTPSNDVPRVPFDASKFGTAPDSIDWVANGAVTPVKDQGQCGSCWSFSTTGSLEGAYYLYGPGDKTLASFSEQMLVDCSKSAGNMGCNGGLMDDAFEWIKDNGLCLESAYPYTGRDGTCETRCTPEIKTISSWTDITNENDLKTAVGTVGPVSIAVDANLKWQLYSHGIMSANFCPKSQLDHGVLAVGYDVQQGYWKVKNSWNTSWGEKGYVRLAFGKNTCGLANQASYPTL